MSWWQVLVNWLLFYGVLDQAPTGATVHSPEWFYTEPGGKRFRVSFHATRDA